MHGQQNIKKYCNLVLSRVSESNGDARRSVMEEEEIKCRKKIPKLFIHIVLVA